MAWRLPLMPEDQACESHGRPGLAAGLRHIEAVVNARSGSVGPDAAARLEALVGDHGLRARVANVEPEALADAVRSAVDAGPDLLIVLAGDGTAALAARTCGPDGPLVAPLPGGTMNMLPHALYGRRAWPEALHAALTDGAPRPVSGGEASGHAFYVAAILGAPALFAEAREAIRNGKLVLAAIKARRALRRAFAGSLRFQLDGEPRRKTEALTLMCPLVSRACEDDDALEAAALDLHNAVEAVRLGLHTLVGDWRNDPAVTVERCTTGRAWARGRIPAILDGEPCRLDSPVQIRFQRQAFRALAPPAAAAPEGAEMAAKRTGAEVSTGAAAAEIAKAVR